MFGFKKNKIFKNDKELSEQELLFLTEVTDRLHFAYPSFKKQLQEDVIKAIAPDPIGGKGSYIFTLDSDQWEKCCDKLTPNFQILGIYANNIEGARTSISIYTHEGLMIGFHCLNAIGTLDLLSIDVSSICEKYFINPEAEEVAEIIAYLKPYAKKLNLSTCFKIKLDIDYYTVKDLGNGNYLAINKAGEVFELYHDPVRVKKLYNVVDDLIRNL